MSISSLTTRAAPADAMSPRPDYLAAAVLQSLSRPLGGSAVSWTVTRTFLLGGLTLGLWPLLTWPRRFAQFAAVERQQLWHMSEWVRLNSGQRDAAAMAEACAVIRLRPVFWIMPVLLIVASVTFGVVHFASRDFTAGELIAAAYARPSSPAQLLGAWTAAMSLAALSHWAQVQIRARDVRRLVRRFNLLLKAEAISSIAPPGLGLGFRPLWLLGGIVLTLCGALWGLPLMLAGSTQWRYITQTSRRTRLELSRRLEQMLDNRRPLGAVVPMPPTVFPQIGCVNPRCRAGISPRAEFCPRCGSRTDHWLDRVA